MEAIMLAEGIRFGFHNRIAVYTEMATRYSAMPIPDMRATWPLGG